jgi:hypothetical protein
MNYTKGEWKVECIGSEGYQVRPDNGNMPISMVKELKRFRPIVISMGGDFETQKANAHLISAAPDMHEALKAIIEHVENEDVKRIGNQCTLCHSYRMMIHNVIAKAETK